MLELIGMLLIGCGVFFIGWRIWKKEQITLINSYHYRRVAKKDRKAYTKIMGQALILHGSGMILTGIINYSTQTSYGWLVFTLCSLVGFLVMILSQIKYNKGLL